MANAWMESVKEYLEPVAKMALDVKDKLEGFDYPPAIVDAYKNTATAIGVEDISPVYVGVGVVAASGVLVLACRSCKAAPKKRKGRGSKKPKAKAKPSANGSASKNGGNGKSGAVAAGGVAMNGRSGTRGLPAKQPKPPANDSVAAPKATKKAPVKAPQPQGKGKGKPVKEAPPVITEEPEPATKKVSKKKAKKAKAAAAAAAPASAAQKKKAAKGSTAANGVGSRPAQQNGGGSAGESDPWGAQHAGGEWQTGPIGAEEAEWETVSHKKSRPRKERTAVGDANTIPGGLGL